MKELEMLVSTLKDHRIWDIRKKINDLCDGIFKELEHGYNDGSSSDIDRTESSCSAEGNGEKKYCSKVVAKECAENLKLDFETLNDSDIERIVANQFEPGEDDFDQGSESGGEHDPEERDEKDSNEEELTEES